MATTANSIQGQATTSNVKASGYDAFLQKLNFSYFGLMAMTITFGSCLGGIAAMYTMQNETPIWQLGIVMACAMANNVAAIGQAPIKWLVNIFAVTSVVNTLMILINI